MKNSTFTKRFWYKLAFLFLIHFPIAGIAQNCCDSVHLTVVADPDDADSCRGYAYYKIDSGTTCVNWFNSSLGYGGLEWNDSAQSYRQRYSLGPGSSNVITVYFTNENGDTICSLSDTVYCRCCEGISLYYIKNAGRTDSCCGFVYFKVDSLNHCAANLPAYIAVTGISDSMVWDTAQRAYRMAYCLNPGGSVQVHADFMDLDNVVICDKTLQVGCDMPDICCDSITVIDVPGGGLPGETEPQCCGTLYVNIGGGVNCNPEGYYVNGTYYNINVGYTYCIPLNTSLMLYFYIIGPGGDTLCTKAYLKNCGGGGEGAPAGGGGFEGFELYPNPVVGKVSLKYLSDLPSAHRVVVYNANGNEVYSSDQLPVKEKGTIRVADLSGLPAGIYLIRIEGVGGNVSHRLSIQR